MFFVVGLGWAFLRKMASTARGVQVETSANLLPPTHRTNTALWFDREPALENTAQLGDIRAVLQG